MSSAKAQLVLVGAGEARRQSLQSALGAAVEVRASGYDADPHQHSAAAALCVELGEDPDPGLGAVARLHALLPDVPVVVIARGKELDLVLRAMRAGAREFLLAADEALLADTLRQLVQRRRHQGVVVTCHGVRGGVGCTTLSVNLGAALQAHGARVVLVDLDLYLGHVPLLLDMDCPFGLTELTANRDRLDGELLFASLPRHPSGLWVLGQAGRIEQSDALSTGDLVQALALLQRHFDFVVVDGVRGLDERALQILDASDRVLLLVTHDILAVRNAQLSAELLRRLAFDERKLQLVVNRAASRGAGMEPDGIAELLRLPLAAEVANDFPAVSRAIGHGKLLAEEAPRSRVVRDLARLAQRISGGEGPKRAGLFGKLFGPKDASPRGGAHGAERPA